jgi:hypothetical protein
MWGALFGLRHDLKRAFFSSYSGKWLEDCDRRDFWQPQV